MISFSAARSTSVTKSLRLRGDLEALEPIHAPDDDLAGVACGADRNVEQGVDGHLCCDQLSEICG
jgi:hypothetical protein